jgi:lysozyme
MRSLIIKILLLLLISATCAAQIKTSSTSVQLKTTSTGIALIKHFEGFKARSYKCPANVWTVGYGTTQNVTPGMVLTRSEAEVLLKRDLVRFEAYVNKVAERLIKWHEFDALVSFTYNLGYRIDDVMKEAIDRGNTRLVVIKILRYNKARVNGNLIVLQGLLKRRKAEAALYQNKVSSSLAKAFM